MAVVLCGLSACKAVTQNETASLDGRAARETGIQPDSDVCFAPEPPVPGAVQAPATQGYVVKNGSSEVATFQASRRDPRVPLKRIHDRSVRLLPGESERVTTCPNEEREFVVNAGAGVPPRELARKPFAPILDQSICFVFLRQDVDLVIVTRPITECPLGGVR